MYSGLIKYIFLPGIELNKVEKKKEGGRSRWQDREAKIEATKLRIFIFFICFCLGSCCLYKDKQILIIGFNVITYLE